MHVKIRKRIGNPTLYNAKINYSRSSFIHRNIMLMKREIIISFLASSLMKK